MGTVYQIFECPLYFSRVVQFFTLFSQSRTTYLIGYTRYTLPPSLPPTAVLFNHRNCARYGIDLEHASATEERTNRPGANLLGIKGACLCKLLIRFAMLSAKKKISIGIPDGYMQISISIACCECRF